MQNGLSTSFALRSRPEYLGGDFRLLLEREFAQRSRQNPHYSLRAFARFLGLESSHLSKILKGQRPISPSLLVKLAERLNLGQGEILGFSSLPSRAYMPLALDLFECLEDWCHYAILELMKLPAFEPSEKWLALRLKTSVPVIHACVERLKRAGLLQVKGDVWRDTSAGFSTHILSDQETSYAHKRAQKRILQLAAKSMDEVPISKRDQSSMMMATSAAKMKEAKLRIAKFRRELCEFLEDTDEKDTVYQLSVSLFPLTEEIKVTKKSKGTI